MDVSEIYNEKMKKALTEVFIPWDLPTIWYGVAEFALQFVSPRTLEVGGDELKELYVLAKNQEKLTYYHFAMLSNTVEERSFDQLRLYFCDFSEYIDFMEKNHEYVAEWNKYSKGVQDAIMQEAIQEAGRHKMGMVKPIAEA